MNTNTVKIPEHFYNYDNTLYSTEIAHTATTYKQARAIAQADVSRYNRKYAKYASIETFFIIGGSWFWGKVKD